MSDESTEIVDDTSAVSRGLSRRNALKAGVAAGVGVAAWSGATITSLGGTPAYAAGCTGVVEISLSDCRNTDQGNSSGCLLNGSYGYHPLKTDLPGGYGIQNNIGEHTCCEIQANSQFTWSTGLKCTVIMEFYSNGLSSCVNRTPGNLQNKQVFGGADGNTSGSINIDFDCYANVTSSSFYSITAFCATPDAPTNCINPPT